MINFAKLISFFLNPVFTLLPILYIIISKFSHDHSYILKWTFFSYAFVLAVAIFVIIGVMLGIFSNFDVSKKEQRPLLFSFSAFAAFCYLISLLVLKGPKILFVAFFAIVFGLITIMIVNKWIKASIHLAAATAALLSISVACGGGYFFFILLFLPLLAWSRVKMKEHTLLETIIGSILGIVITLVVYLVTKQFFSGIIYN
jgi:hypothetical protein